MRWSGLHFELEFADKTCQKYHPRPGAWLRVGRFELSQMYGPPCECKGEVGGEGSPSVRSSNSVRSANRMTDCPR
jgi:hypothetical protein